MACLSALQIIRLINVFTPQKSLEEFQDLWVTVQFLIQPGVFFPVFIFSGFVLFCLPGIVLFLPTSPIFLFTPITFIIYTKSFALYTFFFYLASLLCICFHSFQVSGDGADGCQPLPGDPHGPGPREDVLPALPDPLWHPTPALCWHHPQGGEEELCCGQNKLKILQEYFSDVRLKTRVLFVTSNFGGWSSFPCFAMWFNSKSLSQIIILFFLG